MQENLVFELEVPVKMQLNVAGKNDFVEVDKIYLNAPTYKHKDHTITLKKLFIEAIFAMTSSLPEGDAQKQMDSTNESGLEAKSIKAVMYAAKGFDIAQYHSKFTNFLLKEIAFKDEEKKQALNKLDLEKLDENDFENLVAKYIEVFFIASWMKILS